VIQSGKPIGNIIERNYEKNLKEGLRTLANFLNTSSSDELANLGGTIIDVLNISEETGIGGEEIASLVNSFSSSSFVYNSADYPSSVNFSFDSGKNLTLYFHSTFSEDFISNYDGDSDTLGKDIMLETVPNGSIFTWPARLFSLDPSEPLINSEQWLIWFSFWIEHILMAQPSDEIDSNEITYYLGNENQLVRTRPEGETVRSKLETQPTTWEGISLNRNKIVTNLTADLYLHYPKLITIIKKSTVNVTLFDETANTTIATDEIVLDRAKLLELIKGGPNTPTIFELEDAVGKEIWNNHALSLRISADIGGYIHRPTYILYNSNEYPSSVTLTVEDTGNIKIINEEFEDKEIIPGGSATYVLNITSKYEDTIDIDVSPENPSDLNQWSIEHTKSVVTAQQGDFKVYVYVNSTVNSSAAYGDEIELVFNVSGATGFDTRESKTTVSENAVDYDIEIISPSCKYIKHGESGTYQIKIRNRNTGFWTDSYIINVTSENGWTVTYNSFISDLSTFEDTGSEHILNITAKVPEFTEISDDELSVTVKSQQSIEHNKEKIVTFTITTNVIKPNAFEKIYEYFQLAAEDMGLDEPLGDYAGGFLLFLILFIIFIFIILIVYILKKKYVNIICLDRIREISPDEVAKFDITIKNPTNNDHTYEIGANAISASERWDVCLNKQKILVKSKKSEIVELSIKPNDYVKNNDWVEVKVEANLLGSKKGDKITILASVKEAKPLLNIVGVLHWPTGFKKGDRVTTSFRVTNSGSTSVDNVSVVLYVNDRQKNKVDEINIPRGGYAEIEMPWIAEKGKNEVNIVVK
jgi:hypothetical protein